MNTKYFTKSLAFRLAILGVALIGSGGSLFGTLAIADNYATAAGQGEPQHFARTVQPASVTRECANVAS